jgi:hypothetical protein
VRAEHVGDLAPDRQDRVQVLARVGKRQTQLLAADDAERTLAQAQKLAALEAHAAGGHAPGRSQEPQDGGEQDGLAAARLAEDPQGLPVVDAQSDAVQDRAALAALVNDGQALDLEQRRHAHLQLVGSRKTRRWSPKCEKARTLKASISPGKRAVHQWPVIMFCAPTWIIRPSSGVGGGTPAPTKLRPAVGRIEKPIAVEKWTRAGARGSA